MAKQMELTETQMKALEAYVLTLIRSGVQGVHVTQVIPPSFYQFADFAPESPEMMYDRYSGWFRPAGWTPPV